MACAEGGPQDVCQHSTEVTPVGIWCSFSPILFALYSNSSTGTAATEQGPLCWGENLIWLKEQTETRLICITAVN